MKRFRILISIIAICYFFIQASIASAQAVPAVSNSTDYDNVADETNNASLPEQPARLDPNDVATITYTELPLGNAAFSDSTFLYIRRCGDKIQPQGDTNSDRITNDGTSQIVGSDSIWKTDRIDLLQDETYTVKIHFNYDYDTYDEAELWLHLVLPETTEEGSLSSLVATLTLINPDTGEGIAQTSQYITLHTVDSDQTLKFYPYFSYTELPDTTTKTFPTEETLTSNDNVLFQIPTSYSKGIILINFRSEETLPTLIPAHSTLIWNNFKIAPSPIGNFISIFPSASTNSTPAKTTLVSRNSDANLTVADTDHHPATLSSTTSDDTGSVSSQHSPNCITFTLTLPQITASLICKVIALIVLCVIIVLGVRIIQIRHACKIARIKRQQRHAERQQEERAQFAAEHAALFDDGFLDFDNPTYYSEKT